MVRNHQDRNNNFSMNPSTPQWADRYKYLTKYTYTLSTLYKNYLKVRRLYKTKNMAHTPLTSINSNNVNVLGNSDF